MKCFNHYEKDAVIQCKDCSKGLCPECCSKYNTLLCEECELKRVTKERNHPHNRHTFATMLLNRGENPKTVQELLGHSSVTITLEIYSHVMPWKKVEVMESLHNSINISAKNEVENYNLKQYKLKKYRIRLRQLNNEKGLLQSLTLSKIVEPARSPIN